MTDLAQPSPRAAARRTVLLAAAAIGVVAGLAAVYGIGGLARNAGDEACAPALKTPGTSPPSPAARSRQFGRRKPACGCPSLAFTDGGDDHHSLADWRGRVVLLNLWATWCVPCRKEMPALDGLQARLGGKSFQVVAVNIDTRDPDKPKSWLKDNGIANLAYYADPSAKVFQDLKAVGRAIGMPTTLLVDGAGCEIASLAGPAEWSSDDALKLIQAAVEQSAPQRAAAR